MKVELQKALTGKETRRYDSTCTMQAIPAAEYECVSTWYQDWTILKRIFSRAKSHFPRSRISAVQISSKSTYIQILQNSPMRDEEKNASWEYENCERKSWRWERRVGIEDKESKQWMEQLEGNLTRQLAARRCVFTYVIVYLEYMHVLSA